MVRVDRDGARQAVGREDHREERPGGPASAARRTTRRAKASAAGRATGRTERRHQLVQRLDQLLVVELAVFVLIDLGEDFACGGKQALLVNLAILTGFLDEGASVHTAQSARWPKHRKTAGSTRSRSRSSTGTTRSAGSTRSPTGSTRRRHPACLDPLRVVHPVPVEVRPVHQDRPDLLPVVHQDRPDHQDDRQDRQDHQDHQTQGVEASAC